MEILVYYMDIWSILLSFGIFYGHSVCFMIIWYIFIHFGMLYREKPGNPDQDINAEISRTHILFDCNGFPMTRTELLFFFFFLGGGQQPLAPLLLLLGPSFFLVILFLSTTLLTKMTGRSLHMQWPLVSQSHGSFLTWFFVADQTPRHIGI
jgi:hypothetical protein